MAPIIHSIPFSMAALLLFASCVNHNDDESCELYYPLDSLSSASYIDSTASDNWNMKIYTAMFPSEGNIKQCKTVMVYRTESGEKHVEKRALLDIVNGTHYGCFMPVGHIFQSYHNSRTTYLIQLDCFGGTAHDNSMLVALQISGDSILPVNIFRSESRDTCIIETTKQNKE